MKEFKIKDHKHLVRDSESLAIINNDRTAFQKAKTRKLMRDAEKNKLELMEERIENLSDDISSIKNILIEILDGNRSNSNK